MTLVSLLPFAAAAMSFLLSIASLLRKRDSFSTWCFAAGMALLGFDSLLAGQNLRSASLDDAVRRLTLSFTLNSFLPAAWLGFSLTYSRGDYRASLARGWVLLAIAALLPVGLALGFHDQLVEVAADGEELLLRPGQIAKVLNLILLVANVWVLMNLEQTFRSAVGTMRWRIKFVFLGLVMIFASRLYVQSQDALYSTFDVTWTGIESSGLLIGCVFLTIAYARTGLAEIDVYPSRAAMRSSVTVLLVGSYLFIVGILARLVTHFGGVESLQVQIFLVLLALAILAVLLLSDRLRQRIHEFLERHFKKSQHDSVRIWTSLSQRLANVTDRDGLCKESVRLVSETFKVLSVTIWLRKENTGHLTAGALTAPHMHEPAGRDITPASSNAIAAGLRVRTSPFNLEGIGEQWASELRRLNPSTFPTGGDRWCVPLRAREQSLGALVLADRVNGASYTAEELHLLQCMADQMSSVLLNLRLAEELARSRELEAFQTMSAFFVHDLKNAASSLNLMLKNLPIHFNDPAFREDALRAVGNTARRIDEMIARLSALRQQPRFQPVATGLNQLVKEVLDRLGGMPRVEVITELQPLPQILADCDQIQSVITNLVLNARDALGPEGRIVVRTEHSSPNVVLTVTDNGCGMSATFLQESLFRPFQSTKKNGLGIGMYQSRMIVEAHGGSIWAESEPGKGSTFWVSLPVKDPK